MKRARRFRLTVAYDGTDFFGAQAQPGRRTVAGELEAAISRLSGCDTRLVLAGRTDRGVHAAGQVAHGDVVTDLPVERFQRALNALLPADVVVWGLREVDATFHARYDACWREYWYRVWNAPVRWPALRRSTWHLARPLDRQALQSAAAKLVGEHDFAAFAGQALGVPGSDRRRSTHRVVYGARWGQVPGRFPVDGVVLEFRIRASGFLPQMVRTIVAALVEIGSGRRPVAALATLLAGRDRRLAPAPAPPQGLTLWAVGYDPGALAPDWLEGFEPAG